MGRGVCSVVWRAAEVGEAVDGGVGAVVAPRGQQGARGPVRRRPLRTHFAARIVASGLGFTVLYLFDGVLEIATQPLKELLDRLGSSTYDLLTLKRLELDVFDEETQRGLKKFSGRRVQLPTSFGAMIGQERIGRSITCIFRQFIQQLST